MRFPGFKKVRPQLLVLILVASTSLLVGGYFAFSKTSTPPSKWMKQGTAIRQVGLVLSAYLQKHDDKMPDDIRTLKAWADSYPEYKSLSASPIWSFVSPDGGKIQEWKMGAPPKGVYLYAPEICIRYDGTPLRLVLTNLTLHRLHYNFVREADFERLGLEPMPDGK